MLMKRSIASAVQPNGIPSAVADSQHHHADFSSHLSTCVPLVPLDQLELSTDIMRQCPVCDANKNNNLSRCLTDDWSHRAPLQATLELFAAL